MLLYLSHFTVACTVIVGESFWCGEFPRRVNQANLTNRRARNWDSKQYPTLKISRLFLANIVEDVECGCFQKKKKCIVATSQASLRTSSAKAPCPSSTCARPVASPLHSYRNPNAEDYVPAQSCMGCPPVASICSKRRLDKNGFIQWHVSAWQSSATMPQFRPLACRWVQTDGVI